MAENSESSFGDESLNPAKDDPVDESVLGSPRDLPKGGEPPLPALDHEHDRGAPMVPQSENRSYLAPAPEKLHAPRPPDKAPASTRKIRRKTNWSGLFFWILIACFSLSACYYILKTRQQVALETQELSFKSVRVKTTLSCSDGWQELGFILRSGDQVAITAEGEYLNSVGGRMNGDGQVPSGKEGERDRSYDPLFPHGCLIARTSGNPEEVFHIGTGGILRTRKGGRLQVRVNDLDLARNRGSLLVRARTFLNEAPDGIQLRGSRDSSVTPIRR